MKAFETVRNANRAAAAALKPGATGTAVDTAARDVITAAGYEEFLHATGHAIGFYTHDIGPMLAPAWPDRYGKLGGYTIERDQVFAIEPSLEVELPWMMGGKVGFGLEEDYVVTETGSEPLGTPQDKLDSDSQLDRAVRRSAWLVAAGATLFALACGGGLKTITKDGYRAVLSFSKEERFPVAVRGESQRVEATIDGATLVKIMRPDLKKIWQIRPSTKRVMEVGLAADRRDRAGLSAPTRVRSAGLCGPFRRADSENRRRRPRPPPLRPLGDATCPPETSSRSGSRGIWSGWS